MKTFRKAAHNLDQDFYTLDTKFKDPLNAEPFDANSESHTLHS
jgi:hypothetical protein